MATKELLFAINSFVLDAGPAAALLVLAVMWFVRNRRCREEEKGLRERIEKYKEQGREAGGDRKSL